MEQREGQSSSDWGEGGTTTRMKALHSSKSVKLKRFKSCEDLSTDRKLKRTTEQCLNIFAEYVREKSHSNSNSASVQGSSLADTPAETPTVEKELHQPRNTYRRLRSEPIGFERSTASATSTASHEIPPAVIMVNNSNCSTHQDESTEEEDCIVHSKPLSSLRPCSLGLDQRSTGNTTCSSSKQQKRSRFGGAHRRMPSNSGSDKATTPAPDPPLALFSPGGAADFVETYPPARPSYVPRESASLVPPPGVCVMAGTPESQRHLCCEASTSLPNDFPWPVDFTIEPARSCTLTPQNAVRSRYIAERLRQLGDRFEDDHREEQLGNLLTAILNTLNPEDGLSQYIQILTSLRTQLTWRKVSDIFFVGYMMIERLSHTLGKPHEDERWTHFMTLWEFTVSTLAGWILENGGWIAFLRATEGIVRSSNLTSVDSQEDSAYFGCIPGQPRPRLWSLSETGNLVDDDGVTLLEASQEVDLEEEDHQESGDADVSSDFEGSLGMGAVFSLDDDPFHTVSLPPNMFMPGGEEGPDFRHEHRHESSDDHTDSGILSSMEQLSLSPFESELNILSDASSSPSFFSTNQDTGPSCARSPHSGHATSYRPGDSSASNRFPGASPFDRSRSRSLPIRRRGRRDQRPAGIPRRASEKAMDGLLYTVNIGVNAAFFYAAVSNFLNK